MALSNRKIKSIILGIHLFLIILLNACMLTFKKADSKNKKILQNDVCKGIIIDKDFYLHQSTIREMERKFDIYKYIMIFPNDSLYTTKREEKNGFLIITIQKKFIFKDSLLQKVTLSINTSCCWNDDFTDEDFDTHRDKVYKDFYAYVNKIKIKNKNSPCFYYQYGDTSKFRMSMEFTWQ